MRPLLVEVLQGGFDMENASSPERDATVWCDNYRKSVYDGIRVDGEREYRRVSGETLRCGSLRVGALFIRLLILVVSDNLVITVA